MFKSFKSFQSFNALNCLNQPYVLASLSFNRAAYRPRLRRRGHWETCAGQSPRTPLGTWSPEAVWLASRPVL